MHPVSRHWQTYFEYDVPDDVSGFFERSLRETPEGQQLMEQHLHSATLWVSEPKHNNVVYVQLQDAVTNEEQWKREDQIMAILQLEPVLSHELAAKIVRLV